MLVLGSVGVESEYLLQNKTGWLERCEEGQVFSFFVLDGGEKSVVGVDERLGGDISNGDG